MKKIGGLILLVGLLLAGALVVAPAEQVAAVCNNVSTFGAIRLNVPTLPKSGEYVLWTRVQSPSDTSKLLVEFNQGACIEVVGTGLTPNTWTWVPYKVGGKEAPIQFDYTEGNLLKVIGVQANVRLDRLIIAAPGCVPEEFGNNCKLMSEAAVADFTNVQSIPPPSSEPLSGEVVLSGTPFTQQHNLVSLIYSAGGKSVQTATTAVPFDTTRLENGKYTILIETKLADGTVIRESTVIEIDNPLNVLSPVMRWIRQNRSVLILVGVVTASLAIATILFSMTRRSYLKHRERKFHGF